jgi:Cu(I)/Ag(I) efflux system protein CusF
MKTILLSLALASLAACSQSPDTTASMPTHQPNVPPTATMPTTAVSVATANGEVTAVDTAAGTLTIAHGPVAALNWPAMTMSFRVEGVDLNAVHPGDQVSFEFRSEGMTATITKLTKS